MYDLFAAYDAWMRVISAQVDVAKAYVEGMHTYNGDFLRPLLKSTAIFNQVEANRLWQRTPLENLESYEKLLNFNTELMSRYSLGTLQVLDQYNQQELPKMVSAWFSTMLDREGEKLDEFFIRQKEVLDQVLCEFPRAIKAIESEYGFHFERQPDSLFAETDRFTLHKVQPNEPGVVTDERMKPLIIIPPFVLGANILAFLPGEKKSYAHCFANKAIPTYIRIMKDIHRTPAVQTMSLEDDALDTKYFCEKVKEKHGHAVTLNGYCQGGFSALCNILTGELDGLVDSLITCVAPMDGTRSVGLGGFLDELPEQFNDLQYGTKTLANGNKIASGELMGWVYKLKGIENSGPMVAFLRDMLMLKGRDGKPPPINKTVAAINYWLQNERTDIPLSATEMSFKSYNIPIAADGTLPVSIFGRKLNFHGIKEKKIAWLLCYGETDELVEKEVALAPLDFIDVEVTPFPKGHVAIATSWSHPGTKYALDAVFGNGRYRGPVLFHLDLARQAAERTKP
ncbi:MAG TPA: metal transporter [Desulfobulbaceae bacterium]|nr:metal transporter [Desulfobulbaceae bacterium]